MVSLTNWRTSPPGIQQVEHILLTVRKTYGCAFYIQVAETTTRQAESRFWERVTG